MRKQKGRAHLVHELLIQIPASKVSGLVSLGKHKLTGLASFTFTGGKAETCQQEKAGAPGPSDELPSIPVNSLVLIDVFQHITYRSRHAKKMEPGSNI